MKRTYIITLLLSLSVMINYAQYNFLETFAD